MSVTADADMGERRLRHTYLRPEHAGTGSTAIKGAGFAGGLARPAGRTSGAVLSRAVTTQGAPGQKGSAFSRSSDGLSTPVVFAGWRSEDCVPSREIVRMTEHATMAVAAAAIAPATSAWILRSWP